MQKKDQTIRFFLGIDVGKSELFVALRHNNTVLAEAKFSNNAKGLNALLKWLEKHGATAADTLICIEHTGVYTERLELVVHGSGFKLWKVSANRIHHIQLKADRIKSDPADARKIADFCQRFADQVQIHAPDSPEIRKLKDLTRARQQLVSQRQRTLNFLSTYQEKSHQIQEIVQTHQDNIELFTTQIKKVEELIEELINSQKTLKRNFDILCSIPGIGPVTARQVIISTQGFTRLNCYKKLASFAGTAPFENSSGINTSYKKRRTSKKANQELKKLLTTAVMSIIAKGRFMHEYYLILMAKKPGRLKMQTVNILRNKLLKLIITLVNKDQLFDKELFKENCISWTQ